MTVTPDPDPKDESVPEDKKDKKQSTGKDKKEKKDKAGTKTSKNQRKKTPKDDTDDELESVEPVIKKKEATAKEIDKAQAKRLVVPQPRKKTRKVVRAAKPKIEPRNIGVEVAPPIESCEDPFCPFHGTLPVHGQIINGIVISSRMDKSSVIQREIKRYIPKYERYEKRTHRYAVHNPPCLNAQRGDLVKIMECRPLSKSKSFVIIEKL